MRKITLLVLPIILIAICCFSCKKFNAPNEDAKKLFGEWNYISSTGGIANDGAINLTEDHSMEFTSKGLYRLKKDGKELQKSKYRFEVGKDVDGTEKTAIYYQINTSKIQTFTISNDTLYLEDKLMDGYSYVLVRK